MSSANGAMSWCWRERQAPQPGQKGWPQARLCQPTLEMKGQGDPGRKDTVLAAIEEAGRDAEEASDMQEQAEERRRKRPKAGERVK